jgi:protein-tyrosine-phosphatase
MAEGLSRRHAGDRFEVMSAGCSAFAEIHPHVVRATDGDLARLSEELYPQPLDRG